jgi:spore germination protein GerM
MRKILIALTILIILIGVLFGLRFLIGGPEDTWICENGKWVKHGNPSSPMPTEPCGEKPQAEKLIKLYYYNPQKDKDETGNIKCSRDGLVAIERKIPFSKTPIQDTINLLLRGKENLTEAEKAQGITTEYPLEGFSLKGASLKDGVLTLEFEDSLNKTVGGACRVGILWFQIEATAQQFTEVKKVEFLPEEIFQP